MSLSDEETVLVADTSEEFAEAVVRLYQDESLWNKMSRKGLEFSESNWGAEAAWSTLSSILKDVGFPIAERKNPLVLYQSQSERSPYMSAVTGLEQFTGVGAKAHDKNIGQA
ncbi:MAG: glycosyltransferase family 1 protein [Acidobacteria bacterium]|nr:glycosyltransferase family 1 protein [Acidobacteriota bacterium]